MKKQQGFTLIELIIVIVILGILAVTVAPKFLDLQGDAKKSTLEGVKGALAAANSTIYAKSAIEGENSNAYAATCNDTGTDETCSVNGVGTNYGYIAAASSANIGNAMDIDTRNDWVVTAGTGSTAASAAPLEGYFAITPKGYTADFKGDNTAAVVAKECFVLYKQAASTSAAPTIEVKSGGC